MDIDVWSVGSIDLINYGNSSPSECVWIVPYVNPWLMDWG